MKITKPNGKFPFIWVANSSILYIHIATYKYTYSNTFKIQININCDYSKERPNRCSKQRETQNKTFWLSGHQSNSNKLCAKHWENIKSFSMHGQT